MFDLIKAKFESCKTAPVPLRSEVSTESRGINDYFDIPVLREEKKPNYGLMGLGLLIFVCSVSLIIFGIIHFNDCPAEELIPVCYIVIGGLIFVSRLINSRHDFLKSIEGSDVPPKPGFLVILTVFLQLILLGWFFAGSYFVFSIKSHVNDDDPESPDYCEFHLYAFSFWGTIISLVSLGGFFIFTCAILCYERCQESTSDITDQENVPRIRPPGQVLQPRYVISSQDEDQENLSSQLNISSTVRVTPILTT